MSLLPRLTRPMSLAKAQINRLRDLREKKHREAAGLFVVEGDKVISELLAAHYPLLEIYTTSTWKGPRTEMSANLVSIEVSADEMARISHFPTPSNALAVGKIVRVPLAPDTLNQGLTLALDGIQDPGNVGTMLRLADWFALDRVVLSPDCADLFSQKVINATMGSFARVKVHTASLAEVLTDLPVPVFGCDLQGADVHTLKPCRDGVIVIGSEGRGLSPAIQTRITQRVTIPQYGHAESLNAAIAAAIVCDNLRRLS